MIDNELTGAQDPGQHAPGPEYPECQNCGEQHGGVDACVHGVLARLAADRGRVTAEQAVAAADAFDLPELWARYISPAVDLIEEAAMGRVGVR